MEDDFPQQARDFNDPWVGQELRQVAAQCRRSGGVGRAQVSEQHPGFLLGAAGLIRGVVKTLFDAVVDRPVLLAHEVSCLLA